MRSPDREGLFVSSPQPDRTWHKVNDPKVDFSGDLGEGKVGHEPRLEPCWTLQVIDPLGAIWAWWDTDYFDIVACVLQGDTLAPYLFILCLDYVLWTSIDKININGFKLTKERSRRYPAQAITDADYADNITLLANTPAQAETVLHSLERAPAGIASMSTQTIWNTCVLIKEATPPHYMVVLWN